MPEPSRRAIRGSAWGVAAVVFGAAAVAAWFSVPSPVPWNLLAWVLSAPTAAALYLCFADPLGLWPSRRRLAFDLASEIVGCQVRLGLENRGPDAEASVQVTRICQPPGGKPKGVQHWPVPWFNDNAVEAKRILSGQTRTLDFAVFNPAAVEASISGQAGAAHWRFASVPEPIEVSYYNLIKPSDVDEQEFILTVRLLVAGPGRYEDWQVTLKMRGREVVCECVPIKHTRYISSKRQPSLRESWSAEAHETSP